MADHCFGLIGREVIRVITKTASGPGGWTHDPPGVSGRQKVVLAVIGVAVTGRIVRSRRTYERAILLALVLAAAAGTARAGQARSMARLIAWANQKLQDERRRAEASRL